MRRTGNRENPFIARRHLLRYDKEDGTSVIRHFDESDKTPFFTNDIDGGLSFNNPNSNNQWIKFIDPLDMKETLTSEYFANSEAKDQQANERLQRLVENLGDEDNPVLMKVILKKGK